MKAHPSEQQLRDWLDGSLDEAASRLIEEHLEACPEVCQPRLDRMPAGAIARTRELRLTWSGRLAKATDESATLPPLSTSDAPGASAFHAPSPAPGVPCCPPGYVFIELLGRGGMGSVVRARELTLARDVAVKFVEPRFGQPDAQSDTRFATRFALEAEAMARLRHPNIVPVYAVGDVGGRPFLVMEYAEGGSLADRLRGKGPITPRDAAAVCELLARAAHHAHERGVIHRDLKPSNILLSAPPEASRDTPDAVRIGDKPWVPKVADFGLVKLEDAASPAVGDEPTLVGDVWGSPGFMSPEQARGDVAAVGVRTDVHALGATLYFLLVGKSPFDAPTTAQVIERVKSESPEPPRKLRPVIPADLETICLKALRKSPADRYSSAADLADDLRRFLEGRPIAARPFGPVERAWRWAKRNKALAATLAGLALTMVVGAVVSLAYAVKADRNAADANRNFNAALREKSAADIARTQAETATVQANRNADEVQRRSVELARQLELAEWHAYDTEIALSHEDLRNGDSANARDRLWRGRWDLRSWEHDHLGGMLDGRHGVRRVPLLMSPMTRSLDAFLAADGRNIVVIEDGFQFVNDKATTIAVVVVLDAATGERRRKLATPGKVATLLAQAASRIFAADANGQIVGWNADTGAVTLSLETFRHFGGATSISCSDDGARLLTVASAGALRLWNAESGTLATTFESKDNAACLAAAISGDGGHVAGLFADRTVRLWRSDGTALGSISIRHAAPRVVALDRSATRVATGDAGGGVAVWSFSGHELLGHQSAHQGAVSAIRFSPDGARLATGGTDGTVRLWPRNLNAPAVILHAHAGEVVGLGFAGDGVTLMTSGGNWFGQRDVRLWNVETAVARSQPLSIHNARANSFIHGGKTLLSLHADGVVQFRDADSRRVTAATRVFSSVPADSPVAISPDGQRIAIGRGGTIELVGTLDQRVTTRIPEAAGRVTAIDFPADNRLLALHERGTAIVWEVAPTPNAKVRVDGGVTSAVLSGNGRWLATSIGESAKVKVSNVDRAVRKQLNNPTVGMTGDSVRVEVRNVDDPATAQALPIDMDHETVFLAINRDGGLLTINAMPYLYIFDHTPEGFRQRLRAFQGYNLGMMDQGYGMMLMDLHPDGTRLVAGGMDILTMRGRVELINLHNGAISRTRYVYPHNVRGVRFSPDGTRLLVTYNSGAELYDDGGLLRRRAVLGESLSHLAFAADRRILTLTDAWRFASGPSTPELATIDGHSGREHFDPATRQYRPLDLTSLPQDQRGFQCLDVTPDGRHAVLGTTAGALVVLDVPGYRADRVIGIGGAGVAAVACSPDGTHVATMDEPGTVSLIELATGRRIWSRVGATTRPATAPAVATRPAAAKPSPRRPTADIAWRADAAALAIIDGADVVVLNAATGAPLRPPLRHNADVQSISYDPATARLAVGCVDGTIVLWPPDDEPAQTATIHSHAVTSVRFHPVGGLLLSADVTQRVVVVDGATLNVIHHVNDGNYDASDPPAAVVWARDGATFAASLGGELAVWTLPQPPATRPASRSTP